METVEDILAHYGVKGMRWGVRNSSSGSTSTRSSGRRKKAKTAKELSEDAIVFNALKQKAKTKGLSSLTNKEVETLNKRFELETKYKKVVPAKKNPASRFVGNILKTQGNRAVNDIATAITVAQVARIIATNPTVKRLATNG